MPLLQAEPQLFDWLTKYGPEGVLAAMVVMLLTGVLRVGRQVDQQLADKDRLIAQKDTEIAQWKQMALQGTTLAEVAAARR